MNEPLFEPIARYWRFGKGFEEIKKNKPFSIVDLGCGPRIRLYDYLWKRNIAIKKYIGVDPMLKHSVLNRHKGSKKIILVKQAFAKTIHLPSASADYVVGFAFIEHVKYPNAILSEALRIVKHEGKVILTTPGPRSKLLLEFLAKIGLISKREIEEHKNYFDKKSLLDLIDMKLRKKLTVKHRYFHPWQNNLFVLQKR